MDKFFKISERGSNVRTEIIAGLTTFFAMAYIVITSPNQITSFSTDGALGQIWNAVYVASILVAVIGTLLMALIMMPLTYSISNGIGIGCIAYTLITLCTGKYKKQDIAVTVIALLFVLRFCLITM